MRLIDAEKLKKHYAWWEDDERKNLFDQIVDVQPTVHAVPAVRCWACKYYHTESCPMLREQDGDGYCSFGKPRVD